MLLKICVHIYKIIVILICLFWMDLCLSLIGCSLFVAINNVSTVVEGLILIVIALCDTDEEIRYGRSYTTTPPSFLEGQLKPSQTARCIVSVKRFTLQISNPGMGVTTPGLVSLKIVIYSDSGKDRLVSALSSACSSSTTKPVISTTTAATKAATTSPVTI